MANTIGGCTGAVGTGVSLGTTWYQWKTLAKKKEHTRRHLFLPPGNLLSENPCALEALFPS